MAPWRSRNWTASAAASDFPAFIPACILAKLLQSALYPGENSARFRCGHKLCRVGVAIGS
jgi:hypothetical protein